MTIIVYFVKRSSKSR